MSNKRSPLLVFLAFLTTASAAAAQEAKPADLAELRHHIYVMEGALARAVDFGAQKLNQEVRSVMPDVFVLAGEAQARGVYLDGYGVFFDVQVPMLRQSMMWSLRMRLDQDDTATQAAIADLRRFLKGITDPATRATLESALRRLELHAAPAGIQPRTASAAGSPIEPATAPGAVDKGRLVDPNRAYTEAVQRALIDAMIDFSPPMSIAPNQWLTVAARDNERRDSLAPQDPFEQIVTVLLRIQGSDLLAYRTGKIDKEEARRRVRVGEF